MVTKSKVSLVLSTEDMTSVLSRVWSGAKTREKEVSNLLIVLLPGRGRGQTLRPLNLEVESSDGSRWVSLTSTSSVLGVLAVYAKCWTLTKIRRG